MIRYPNFGSALCYRPSV